MATRAATAEYPRGLTVAVMNYNEAKSLRAVVEEIRGVLLTIERPFEIVIINDGSTDGSGEIADALAAEYPEVRVIHHPVNLGLGAVYRNGFTCGRYELATLFPADGQFEAAIIPRFIRRFDEADMVLGFIREYGKNRKWLARFFSWGERTLVRVLFGQFPEFQGIMMFRRALVDTVKLTSRGRGWIIQMELILRFIRKGYRIVNEPTGLRARMSGESKVNNLKSILSNLRQLFVLRLHF
jgi:dolichol-phosphate mannosyltransferase